MRFTYHTGARPLAGFTIQRGIHRGGFGEVYFAQSDAGKEVALKLLHREERDVEIRGVSQCLNLKHPNLVSLYDLKTDSLGDHWIVMEYVSGSSLEDVLISFPHGLPPEEVRDWLKGLVAGVTHLHDRGIVHRDLKPANVYRENGVVKIGDVGLSKRIDSDRHRLQTQSVGTVYYMAPEVAKGQYGPEVDVYSLGVMLYELITGKLPFHGETTAEILMKHLTAQPDLTPIPKSLRPVVARALEKDPTKRTPTARQLERDFLNARESSEPMMIPESSFIASSPHAHSFSVNRNCASDGPSRKGCATPQPVHLPQHNGAAPSKVHRAIQIVLGLVMLIFILPIAFAEMRDEFRGGPLQVFGNLAVIAVAVLLVRLWMKRPQTNGHAAFATAATDPFRKAADTPPMGRMSPLSPAPTATQIDFAGRMGSVALGGTIVSLVAYFLLDVLKKPVVPSMEHAALFAATTVVGSWLLLTYQALADSRRWKKKARWRARVATGLLCGTCAFLMDRFLIVDTPQVAFTAKSMISSIGSQPLLVAGTEATWLGYALFFAALFGIRRWSHEMDLHRRQRIQLFPVAAAAFTAFVTSMVIAFPQWYAMLWAGAISATLQLASDCQPIEKRLRTGVAR